MRWCWWAGGTSHQQSKYQSCPIWVQDRTICLNGGGKVCFYSSEVKLCQSYMSAIKVCKGVSCQICFRLRLQIRARKEFWSMLRKWKMSLISESQSFFLFVLIFVPFLKALRCWLCLILHKTLKQNRIALVLFNFWCPELVALCKHLNWALYFLAFFLCSAFRFFCAWISCNCVPCPLRQSSEAEVAQGPWEGKLWVAATDWKKEVHKEQNFNDSGSFCTELWLNWQLALNCKARCS